MTNPNAWDQSQRDDRRNHSSLQKPWQQLQDDTIPELTPVLAQVKSVLEESIERPAGIPCGKTAIFTAKVMCYPRQNDKRNRTNAMILHRHKVLLSLIYDVNRCVSDIELTKWAFLIRHEHESRGGSAFYEFVPYLYGPFSFSLNQEAGKLVEKGLLTCPSEKTWASASGSLSYRPDQLSQRGVNWVLDRFSDHSADDLMDYVYSRYPQYTVHSKRKKLAQKIAAEPAVYTAGYEGLSVDGFLYRLIDRGIRHLIDVRHNPIARRFGFHKSTLNRLCESLGIRYSHVPSLGIHSSQRQELDSQGDYDSLFAIYRSTTLKHETDSIRQVSEWITESPSVLVCMEADPCTCHRTHLAAAVAKETGLPVVDLGTEINDRIT